MTAEKHKSQRSDSKLTTEVRIAFPYFHEKRTKRANGKALDRPRHDAVVLVPKLNPDPAKCANYAMLAAHCMEAAAKAWPGVGWPQGGRWPIQDGDVPYKAKAATPGQPVKPVDPNAYAWRRGNWVIEISYNLEPGPRVALLQNGQAVEIPAKTINGQMLYKSGDYGIVSLHAYTYANETFGANFGFEGVMFTRPGEAIGSSGPRSAEQMFGDVAGKVAPPALAPPASGAPPVAPAAPPQMPAPPAPLAPPAAAPPAAPAAVAAPGLPPFPQPR